MREYSNFLVRVSFNCLYAMLPGSRPQEAPEAPERAQALAAGQDGGYLGTQGEVVQDAGATAEHFASGGLGDGAKKVCPQLLTTHTYLLIFPLLKCSAYKSEDTRPLYMQEHIKFH